MTAEPRSQSVIPTPAYITAAIIAGVMFLIFSALAVREEGMPPPAKVFMPVMGAAFLGGYVLLVGYVYGDARRRNMRYVLWTFLVILAPSGIGFILYFILRDSIPVHCTRCGAAVGRRFAYCPRCGASMNAVCGQCHRVAESGWSHCAWCGAKL